MPGKVILVGLPVGLAFCAWMAQGAWSAPEFAKSPAGQAAIDGAPVAMTEPERTLVVSGRIVSGHSVRVATKVSGQVAELSVEAGQSVRAGQTLARVEDVEYRALRDMHAARLREARALLKKAKHDYRRAEDLRKKEMLADTEWINAEASLEQAEARLAAEQAALTLASKRFDDCVIESPIAGVVLSTHVSAGEFVAVEGGRSGQANALVATVADVDDLRVELDVSERDIARIRPEMRCNIIPDAYPDRSYSGSVLRIDPSGNYSKGAVGVKVRIDEPDAFVRIGGSARVEFLGD